MSIGSLCAASRSASRAGSSRTPATSKSMRPRRTTATQNSGGPLPLPMRVSAGFLETGLSGKMRIHTLPPRFIECVMARRAASIWRAVIQALPSACRPNSPNATVAAGGGRARAASRDATCAT